jgi:integrase
LTDRGIEALKAKPSRYEVWDDARKGFGIRVTPRGVKSFVWVYHFAGKPRRMTFGPYPKLSLADAGVKFAESKRLLETGIDPGTRIVTERAAERAAEIVAELVSTYLDRYARPRKRSAGEDERILHKDVLPRWGDRKVRDITRRDVVMLLNSIVDRGAPIQANRTFGLVRRMFRFAIGQAIIEHSPCDNVEAPSAENRRDRVLTEEEIRLLWCALDDDTAPMGPNARRILKFMLATGQRRGEVMGLRIDEVDHNRRLWTLPASRSKNGRDHLIPISSLAHGILTEALPHATGFVFPSGNSGEPYKGQSIDHAVQHLFETRRRAKGRKAPRVPSIPPLAGKMDRFTPHDLRRTVATRMRELGISRGDVKMVLNHVETDVTSRYDRYDGLGSVPNKRILGGADL